MRRHFSNRGEALAEMTAAKVLVDRRALANSPRRGRSRTQAKRAGWFSLPEETKAFANSKETIRNRNRIAARSSSSKTVTPNPQC